MIPFPRITLLEVPGMLGDPDPLVAVMVCLAPKRKNSPSPRVAPAARRNAPTVSPVKLEKGERLPWLYSKEPVLLRAMTWLAVPAVDPTCRIRPLELPSAAISTVPPGLPVRTLGRGLEESKTLPRESLVPSKEMRALELTT